MSGYYFPFKQAFKDIFALSFHTHTHKLQRFSNEISLMILKLFDRMAALDNNTDVFKTNNEHECGCMKYIIFEWANMSW